MLNSINNDEKNYSINASSLHQYEKKVLQTLGKGFKKIDEIASHTGLGKDAIRWALYQLQGKKLVKIHEKKIVYYEIGEEGKKYLDVNFPEVRLLKKIGNEAFLDEIEFEIDEKNYGIPWAIKNGWIKIFNREGRRVIVLTDKGKKALFEEYLPYRILKKVHLKEVLTIEEEEVLKVLKNRGEILKEKEIEELEIELSPLGKSLLEKIEFEEEVNVLTRELIITGKWKEVKLRPYDVKAFVPRIYPGRKHPYQQIIDDLKSILIGLGFEEAYSSPIEINFWNCDALFMPSDHPARGIHDIFYLKKPNKGIVKNIECWKKVGETHLNGWKTDSKGWGSWDSELALRLILRSQTTAVSARYLSNLRIEDIPKKIFTIDRVYRPDPIDATHLPEFNQCEGIVVAPNVNLRNLIGYMRAICEGLGIKEVKFQPAFFPFTEPSVAGYVKHEKLGWIEALPGGIFRPEVTLPLGINVPVLAWGLGIDRLAMIVLGVDDIRTLFSTDLEWIRNSVIPKLEG
ncbi:MAG: phenylalanine--tRNA ligase subunit alpha [Nitrososphaerota archaeon]